MRLIDADALREAMYHEAIETGGDMQKWDSGCWIRYKMFENALRSTPTIDPVKHGNWVYKGVRGRFPVCECSVCGNAENADWAILGDDVNYCPKCGAKMDL